MSVFTALLLGSIQGITEFLPISSSGHLILLPQLFGLPQQPLVFDVFLHLGTTGALLYFFFGDLTKIIKAVFKDVFAKKKISAWSLEAKLGFYIIAGSLPAGILGVLFDSAIELYFRVSYMVLGTLVFGSMLMTLAEQAAPTNKSKLTFKKAIFVGGAQALALVPGISRSGVTIAAGLVLGIERDQAARFSFLLSVPIVLAAAVFKVATASHQLVSLGAPVAIAGIGASFVCGVAAIKFLLGFLKTNSLYGFVAYRLILCLGIVLLVLVA